MGTWLYSPAELYGKVDWEGGLYEAAFGYGINAESISEATPQGVELKKAWAEMEEAHRMFAPKFDTVAELLDAYADVVDPDDLAIEV